MWVRDLGGAMVLGCLKLCLSGLGYACRGVVWCVVLCCVWLSGEARGLWNPVEWQN